MKFAREKQREESALHNQPALHRAAPTYKTQTSNSNLQKNIHILKAGLNIIIHSFPNYALLVSAPLFSALEYRTWPCSCLCISV